MRKLLIALLLLMCVPGLVLAKDKRSYEVSGTVNAYVPVKSPTEIPGRMAPVPHCDITLTSQGDSSQTFTATTDAMGMFLIKEVPPGKYTVTASRPNVGAVTQTMTVGGPVSINTIGLRLQSSAPSMAYQGPGPNGAPVTGTGTAPSTNYTSSGHVYVALSPTRTSLAAQQASHADNRTSFGRTIPGPPTWSQGWKGILMLNGGDPYLLATGRRRPNPSDVYNEGHVSMPVSIDARAMMRMDAGRPGDVQYARQSANPYWLTLDAAGTRLFVATDQNSVDIYDANTMSQVGHIPTGGMVTDLVRSPDGNWIFAPVAAGTPGVIIIDPRKDVAVRFIPTPALSTGEMATPTSVAVSADSTRMYVSLSTPRAGEVAVMDTMSKRLLRRVKVGPQPLGLALTPDGRLLFVANNASASVSVIDAMGMSEITRVHVGISPCRVVVTPSGTKAYVSCKGSNTVAVISGTSTQAGTIPVDAGPLGMAVSQDGRKVFVTNSTAGTVSVISTDRDVVESTTQEQPKSSPFGIAIGP